METNADRGSKSGRTSVVDQRPLNSDRAIKSLSGRIEGDEETIACRADDLASVTRKEKPKSFVVPSEELLPGLVAHGAGEARRVFDIGEHEGLPNLLRLTAASGGGVDESFRGREVVLGTKVSERLAGGFQFEVGSIVVSEGTKRRRKQDPIDSHFVGSFDFSPALYRRPQPSTGFGGFALCQEDPPPRFIGRCS
jgi:hypothetical protein